MTKKNSWLTVREIADNYGVTRQAVEKWIKRYGLKTKVRRELGKRRATVLDPSEVRRRVEYEK